MTLVKTDYSGNTVFIRLSGTIAEVLQKAANLGIDSGKAIYYSDDDTNAKMIICMTK